MADEVETRLRALIGEVSKHDTSSLGPDDDLVERLGIDSLQGLQILAAVEKRFSVRLADEELGNLRTIHQIMEAIQRAGAGGGR